MVAEIARATGLAGRQHGDHDLGVLAGIGDRRGPRTAAAGEPLGRSIAHVEACHRVTGPDQVLRHRQPHIAESDEADLRHDTPPGFPAVTGLCVHAGWSRAAIKASHKYIPSSTTSMRITQVLPP